MGVTISNGAGLLRAVLADPSDTLARLVYADWLDENGQGARADVIRLQIEHDRDGGEPPAAVEDLLRHNWEAWMPPRLFPCENPLFRERPLHPDALHQWQAGFISRVKFTGRHFFDRAAEVFGTHPIRSVWLVDSQDVSWRTEHSGRVTAAYLSGPWSFIGGRYLWRVKMGWPTDHAQRVFSLDEVNGARRLIGTALANWGRLLAELAPVGHGRVVECDRDDS